MARTDPLRNFKYLLEIDGITQGGFSEVAIGEATNEPIEYREGDERTTVRKLTALNKFANITLKWGLTPESKELSDWWQQVVNADPLDDIRRNVVIRVQTEAGDNSAAYEVERAWPCKFDPTDLNGTGNEVAIDTLELCNEGIRRIN
jgi:phage tail-like protein